MDPSSSSTRSTGSGQPSSSAQPSGSTPSAGSARPTPSHMFNGRLKTYPPEIHEVLTEEWYQWGKCGGGSDNFKDHARDHLAYCFGVTPARIDEAREAAEVLLLAIPGDTWRSCTGLRQKNFVNASINERAQLRANFPFFDATHTPSWVKICDKYREGAYNRFWSWWEWQGGKNGHNGIGVGRTVGYTMFKEGGIAKLIAQRKRRLYE